MSLPQGTIPKPPLGPEPEWIWREKRMWHLIERMNGFAGQLSSLDKRQVRDHLRELAHRIDQVLAHRNGTEPETDT